MDAASAGGGRGESVRAAPPVLGRGCHREVTEFCPGGIFQRSPPPHPHPRRWGYPEARQSATALETGSMGCGCEVKGGGNTGL